MRARIAIVLLAAVGPVAQAQGDAGAPPPRASVRTISGTVVAVNDRPAEGDLPVVAVALESKDDTTGRLEILLAPRRVMDEIEFAVEEGDSLRVRLFVADQGPFKAHKVMNLTRDTMVRFRTLRGIPLWDTRGEWAGGEGRRLRDGRGPHGRGVGPRR
jgi:hypothetical protein